MLPEYLPGIHPLLVHFPLALLLSAALVDLVAVVTRRDELRRAATALLVSGTLLLPLTYWSGHRASERVASPFPAAQAVMAEHADLAWWTMWLFLALGLARALLAWRGRLDRRAHAATLIVLLAASSLLVLTAEHGGRLVFGYGVGVQPVRTAPPGAFDPEPEPDPAQLGPTRLEDGGLRWRFQDGAASVLDRFVSALGGSLPAATVETRHGALVLAPTSAQRTLLALGDPVASASVRVAVERAELQGRVGLALHATADTYDYLWWDGATLALGVRRDGQERELGRAEIAAAGWHELELVAAGTHIRAYVDGELVVHGHTEAPAPGPAALLIEGTGRLRIDDLRITPLSE